MKIAMSCKEVKTCVKCKEIIYTTDIRWNRHDGNCEHLKCEVKNGKQEKKV